jgi:DNA (cytosine-5)-methyltransferase 1
MALIEIGEKLNANSRIVGATPADVLGYVVLRNYPWGVETIKFIDLFAGLGGLRLGLEKAASQIGLKTECVFTSEIKKHAIETYSVNFPGDEIHGDITQIQESEIPDFDVLLAGFPCQPFSSAGKGLGFTDTRGTLFFDIERILKHKKPQAFILENVEGLVKHDRLDKSKLIGRTLEVIIEHLESLGYKVSWKVFDASEYGLAQKRKRIYIVGTRSELVSLDDFDKKFSTLNSVLVSNPDSNLFVDTPLTQKLLTHYKMEDLIGKQVRDKRGGPNNIHSWNVGLKGEVSDFQEEILEVLLRARRRKGVAISKGIPWSDGMPLTLEELIGLFVDKHSDASLPDRKKFKAALEGLVSMGYLGFEAPKKAPESPKGYNIVTGKLSFDISHILNPKSVTPTLVATDVTRLAIPQGDSSFRRLSVREGLRLFGFPDSYEIPQEISYSKAFDLLGNSVTLNVVEMVAKRVLATI